MLNDLNLIFFWWVMILGIGLIFWPLTFIFFKGFFDRGWIFAKIIGILLTTYLVWLLGSFHLLPFLRQTIWLVLVFAFLINLFLVRRSTGKIKKATRSGWRLFLGEELLFLAALAFWSWVRGFQPNIQGLEKFMDFGFVNSLLRSNWFPPLDIWLAGSSINYYYFGHLVAAVLTKLSGIDGAVTYNLLIATLFASTLVSGFSLSANLINQIGRQKKPRLIIGGGLLAAFLLSLGGNLHPLWRWLKDGNFASYWYPDATRFIVQLFGAADNTIHEFPVYSFVVADLHGHLLNLPFVLLFLALVLRFWSEKKLIWQTGIFLALLLGVFYMTNTWDFAVYHLLLGSSVLCFYWLKHRFSLKTIIKTASVVGPILAGSLLFCLPYLLHFENITTGLALVDFHSPPWMLLVLWGLPLFLTFSYLSWFYSQRRQENSLILLLLGLAWFLIAFPEFFYLKDIYIHSYQRANTMFKLTYQSFVIFSLLSGLIIVEVLSGFKKGFWRLVWSGSLLFLLFFVLLYPYFAIGSYYGLNSYQGLYGLNYLKNSYPNDYAAIVWLKSNVTGQPVILEAVGESYTDFARVSANTGLPTVLGWRVHEWLWRGSFDEAGRRTEEVKQIYESPQAASAQELLQRYQVSYVFLGTLERQQYSLLKEKELVGLGQVVFSSGQTKVIYLGD